MHRAGVLLPAPAVSLDPGDPAGQEADRWSQVRWQAKARVALPMETNLAGIQMRVSTFRMSNSPYGFQCVKVVALAATDGERANRFYGETLGLPPAYEGGEQIGFDLGGTVLMPKTDWYGSPTDEPNFRITIRVDDAPKTQAALQERGVRIADPVEDVGGFHLGSFLDSEGNKLWFCSVGEPAA